MLTLYKIRFFFRKDVKSLQPIIASARTKRDAVKRARAFVATHYRESIVLEDVESICEPDS